ncbi:carbamoyl-phosphate synthase [Bacillus cereus]|uniref:phage tail protein n=1 Tax=Bacillus cereus TaxID=1396 RepID=UPI001E31FB17|nr:carbamoyl-phosphate synthase [Bacillus cereus]MCC2397542.1 carbamoyl-phosphate synthase [Bacillus cereus]
MAQDGRVEIQARLDDSNIRRDVEQVNRELGRIGSNMGSVGREMRNTFGSEFTSMNRDISRGYTQVSSAHQAMMNEMKSSYIEQKANMTGVREKQIEAQYGYFQLAQSTQNYTGSMSDLISRINEVGAVEKKAKEEAMNADRSKIMSIYQTIGAMNNASSIASKLQGNLDRMNNPLYNTSRLALTAVDSLDRLARSGSPQQLALEFLGANASVKQYNEFIRTLNTQMMAMPVIFALATAGAIMFYGALHKSNMAMNPKYAEAYSNMMGKLSKAFQPMKDAFASVMIPLFNFVAKMAELVIKFNEAHPVLAKFIQGTMMLVPALMVLLTPLALGIGYFAGLRAILFALRPILMPIISGFAMMTAPAWILAGAIAGLTVLFTHLWKTNEGFRNSIMAGLGAVQQFGQAMVALGKYLFWTAVDGDYLNDWITHLPEPFQATALAVGQSVAKMRDTIVSAFAPIMQFGQHILNLGQYLLSVLTTGNLANQWLATLPQGFQNVANLLGTAVLAIKARITELVEAFRLALGGDTSALGQIFMTIIPTLIGLLVGGLPALLLTATRFLPTIVEGINTNLPLITQTITNIITNMVNLITTYLPQFLNQGIQILTKLIEGIVQVLPQIITTLVGVATQIVTSFVTVISTLLPVILEAGIKILMAVIDGIVQNLPKIIESAMQVIDTLINAIVTLLPQIIDAGVKILFALIDGIVKILPQLIETAIMLITKICDMLIQNLPKLIDAGMKILMSVIDGIIKILPQLIDAGIKIIVKLVEILIQNLPKLIDAGVKILTALIEGIIRILPKLIETGLKLIVEIAKAIISNLPKILEAGKKILEALISGIVSLVGKLLSTIGRDVIDGIKNCFSNAGSMLKSAGKDIINGLINGATSMAKNAVSAVKGIASDIKNAVTGFFKIHSPSRLMYGLGEFVTEGLANGISDMSNYAVKQAKSMSEAVLEGFQSITEDIVMGDLVAGGINNDALASSLTGFKGHINSKVQPVSSAPEVKYIVAPQEQQVRPTEGTQGKDAQGNTYILMDKKVVGELISDDVNSASERKKARLATFNPQVTTI